MTSRTIRKRRRITLAPVTTMEEIPVLDENERAEFIRTLKQAEADITAGKGTDFDQRIFRDRLVGIYRRARQQR